jgi:hypothetical protein
MSSTALFIVGAFSGGLFAIELFCNPGTFITTISSVVSGVLVYAISKSIIDGYIKQRQIISEILYNLIFYRNKIGNNDDNILKEISTKFRMLSSELLSKTYQRPIYNFLAKMCITIQEENIHNASSILIRFSNQIMRPDIYQNYQDDIDKITKLLCLHKVT